MTAKAKGWRYGRVSPLLEMGPAPLFYQIPFVTFLFPSPLTAKMLRFVDGQGRGLIRRDGVLAYDPMRCAAGNGMNHDQNFKNLILDYRSVIEAVMNVLGKAGR